MLYTNTLDAEQKLDRHLVCGSLPKTTELYIALADFSGRILPDTIHRFRVNQGGYRCTAIRRDWLTDGGLLSGCTATIREFSAVHIGYSAANFQRSTAVPVRHSKYLVVSTQSPRDVPGAQLKETQKMEENPYHQDLDRYLASIGAGAEPAESYQDNLLVSQPESVVPTAVLADGYVVVPMPFCTVCRVALKLTTKDLIVGLRVQFRNN